MKKTIIFCIFFIFLSAFLYADKRTDNPYLVKTIEAPDGQVIDQIYVPGGYPPEDYEPLNIPLMRSDVYISGVPGFDWAYGCSATSVAMAMGYYDRNGYPNMYTGPTNGGVCPLPTSEVPVWGYSPEYECPLSATHNGFDGRVTNGHVDDYWISYGSPGPDPWVGNWTEHTYGDCTGDYMKTNQWITDSANSDGATTFYYYTNGAATYAEDMAANPLSGIDGVYDFIYSRVYSIYHNGSKYVIYNQYIEEEGLTYGFTFTQYQNEIDNDRPVLIQVEGHTMVGVGYNDATNEVLLHDTWGYHRAGGSYTPGRMTWAGTYTSGSFSGAHYGVSIFQLTSTSGAPGYPSSPSPGNGSSGVSIDTGLSWTNGSNTEDVEVYFSSTESDVTGKNPSARVYNGTAVSSLSSSAISCSYSTTHYWRVVASNSNRLETDGDVWSFTTETEPTFNPPQNLTASVTNNDVSLDWDEPATGTTMELANDDGSVLYHGSFWNVDDRIAANLGLPTRNYPITIDTLKFVLYDYNSAGSVDVSLHIYDTNPDGSPGTELYASSTFSTSVFSIAYTPVWNVYDISSAGVTVSNSFFVAVELESGTAGSIPSPMMDDQTVTDDHKNYYYYDLGAGTQWYNHSIWAEPSPGYNVIRAVVTTSSRETVTLSNVSGTSNSVNDLPDHQKVVADKLPFSVELQSNTFNIDQTRALSGYNIYRNGSLHHTISNPATTSWTDLSVPDGSYTYYVTATYDTPTGESDPSNHVFATVRYTDSILKWSQPPTYNPDSEYPQCFWGWDEWSQYTGPQICADDWLCETEDPITGIHWWGSYLGYDGLEPPEPIPALAPIGFHLGIWTDIPSGGGNPFSHPGEMLWETYVGREDTNETYVGCDYHPESMMFDTCFEYNYELPMDYWFYQEPGPNIYWISISAVYDPEAFDPTFIWGWKTRENFFNDDAVEIYSPTDPIISSEYTSGEPVMVGYDLAFELTTRGGGEEEREFGDAPENALAYPSLAVTGNFPTCKYTGPAGYIEHNNFGANFGPTYDFETEGNAGLCPSFTGLYDQDECFQDGDAGLLVPPSYTITGSAGSESVVSCTTATGALGPVCTNAIWGANIDIDVSNFMPSATTGYVNVLIDWNQDGVWAGSSVCPPDGASVPEHVLVNFGVPNGFSGPLSAWGPASFLIGPNPGYFWVRFSITEVPVTLPWDGSGIFEDGETEDYLLWVDIEEEEEFDWGDAPDPYPTLEGDNGARHIINPNIYLGSSIDAEDDGIPSAAGDGDDNDGLDDEDGVTIYGVEGTFYIPGYTCDVDVTASVDGYLNAWADFDGDNAWADLGEQIFDNTLLSGGLNELSMAIPNNAYATDIALRFRFTSYFDSTAAPTGLESDGEVEDYVIEIEPMDYGDAPQPYPTLLVDNGARHLTGFTYLGPLIDNPDIDPDGSPSAGADGDDTGDANDDEDGVTIPTLKVGRTDMITVEVNGNGAYLHAWCDFDQDGSWTQLNEYIYSQSLPVGIHNIPITVPYGAVPGQTYARFRICIDPSCSPTGFKYRGEVEDHIVTIEPDTSHIKWSQPPTYNPDSPEPGHFWGWDELSIYGGNAIVADDWLCEDYKPVTDIIWWGSYHWWDGIEPPTGPGLPVDFHVGIWTDVPVGSGNPWSHPGTLIWEYIIPRDSLNETWVGMDWHPDYEGMEDACFEYHLDIPEALWFYQLPETGIYWLSVAAIYDDTPEFNWGWKTRLPTWNDAAVEINDPTAPMTGSDFVTGQPVTDLTENPWDMSFVLGTEEIEVNPPVDITITVYQDSSLTKVEWTASPGARYYIIYSSTDPYATFPGGWTILGITPDLYWNDGPPLPTEGKKFYKVVAY